MPESLTIWDAITFVVILLAASRIGELLANLIKSILDELE